MAQSDRKVPLLSVEHLRVEFPTRRGTLVAVDDVSFHIDQGEVLGVVGESGAGKSLTGAAIIGLLEPPGRIAGGQISFGGERIDNIGEEKVRRLRGDQIAMIFQDPLTSLNPLMSVGRQLTETIRTHVRIDERKARVRAIELLNEVGIPAADRRIDQYPHQFSGGMRQRVVIALALAANLWVDRVFLPDSSGPEHAVMQEFYTDLEGVSNTVRGEGGKRSEVAGQFERLQARIDRFVDGTLALLGAMLLKSLIIPLLFLYGLIALSRALLRDFPGPVSPPAR